MGATVSVSWHSQGMSDVPADDGWLSPREAKWVERMRFEKPNGGICIINYPFVFSGLQDE